jgi:hypothetical protein
VDMHVTDLVGINDITRVLLVYPTPVSKVYTLEATYYPFDSQKFLSVRRIKVYPFKRHMYERMSRVYNITAPCHLHILFSTVKEHWLDDRLTISICQILIQTPASLLRR